jgi:hypothetical protein
MENDQSKKQQIVSFASSENATGAIELMKSCRTQLTTVLADSEFRTLVNALTLEIEANIIQRVVIMIDKIRKGEITINDISTT